MFIKQTSEKSNTSYITNSITLCYNALVDTKMEFCYRSSIFVYTLKKKEYSSLVEAQTESSPGDQSFGVMAGHERQEGAWSNLGCLCN